MSSTREAYGAALTELADKYEFFVFDADLSKATQTVHFAKKYPGRFTDMGIAECNMMERWYLQVHLQRSRQAGLMTRSETA